MVDYIDQGLSDRPITEDAGSALITIQREDRPVLRKTRDKLNSLIREQRQFKVTVGPIAGSADLLTDGVNDEVEIQKALDDAAVAEASSRRVELQPGIYYFSGPVYIPSDVSFVGSGRGRTFIVVQTDFPDDTAEGVFVIRPSTNPNPIGVSFSKTGFRGENFLVFNQGADLSAFEEDSYAIIESGEKFNPTDENGVRRGEICKVHRKGGSIFGRDGSILSTSSETGLTVLEATTSTPFTGDMVGQVIAITGSTSVENNGAFIIVSVDRGGSQISFYNQNGDGVKDLSGEVIYEGPCMSIYGGLRDNYSAANGGKIMYVPWVRNVEISGFEFTQAHVLGTRTSSSGQGAPFVTVSFGLDIDIYDLHVRDSESPGISLQSCNGVRVNSCTIGNITDQFSELTFASGLSISGVCENIIISQVTIDGCSHGVSDVPSSNISSAIDGSVLPADIGGSRGVSISSCLVTNFRLEGFVSGMSSDGWMFEGCLANTGESYGYRAKGFATRFLACVSENCTGGFIVGDADDNSSIHMGSDALISGCSVRRPRNSRALPVSGDGVIEIKDEETNGNGPGVFVKRADHFTIINNSIEFCGIHGIVLAERATNGVVQNNYILDFNHNRDDTLSSFVSGILLSRSDNIDVEISAVGADTATVKITGDDTFYKGLDGGIVGLRSFANVSNNKDFDVVNYVSDEEIEVSGDLTGMSVQTGGTLTGQSACWNYVAGNQIVGRSVHPRGYGLPAVSPERDSSGKATRGINIAGTIALANSFVGNRFYGVRIGLAWSSGGASSEDDNIDFDNHGSPEAQGIPVLSPGSDVAISDSDYVWSTSFAPLGNATVGAPNSDTGLQLVTDASSVGFFSKYVIGRTIFLSGFADPLNNGAYSIQSYEGGDDVLVFNPYGSSQSGGTWSYSQSGPQDGAMSYHGDDNVLYMKNGSATHTEIKGRWDGHGEYKIEFTPTYSPSPTGLTHTDVDTGVVWGIQAYLDPSEFPEDLVAGKTRVVRFACIMTSTVAGGTIYTRLAIGTSANAVTSSEISTASNSPTYVESSALTVGSGTNDIQENGSIYRVQGRYTGTPTACRVHNACLIVRYE